MKIDRRLRKKRKRARERARHKALAARSTGPSEWGLKLAARLSLTVGLVLIGAALVLAYLVPRWNAILGAQGNLAMRVAGVALVLASLLFGAAH